MKLNDHNLILVGNSGSGKTTQAEALAGILKRSVFDIDAEIVKYTGKEIVEIFGPDKKGEPYFRGLETEFLAKGARQSRLIIVPGAGAVCNEQNRILMRASGINLWIDPALHILLQRLEKKRDRPNAQNPADIVRRYWERRDFCADVADLLVSFDVELPTEEVTEHILRVLKWKG